MYQKKRPLILAAIVLSISSLNFSRLSGIDCIRPIHIVTLLTMGGALTIIVQQLIQKFNSKD
jgi:hypothetical protein